MRVELLPQQFDFVADDESRRCLIYGGRGSSKSTGLGHKTYRRANRKGACEFLGRQRLIDLRTTTLRVMLEGVGGVAPIIPPGTYHHDKTEKIIRLSSGGQIVYNGMDQGDVSRQLGSTGKGSSMNLTGANLDEAVEISEPNLIQIAGAVRVKIPGLPLQINMACNPATPSHYLAKHFGLAQGHQCRPGYRAILCNPKDNYFLPPEFIEELEQLEGVAYQRYVLGKWVGSDGLVYDRWDRQVHVQVIPAPPKRVALGVDDGYNDPFVCLRGHVDPDGRVHIASEVYESKLIEDEKVARVKDALGSDRDAPVYVDSASPALIERFRREGINAIACTKGADSVVSGIAKVQKRLVVQGDGSPRLTVDPSCVNTIREFESYEWKPGDGGLKDKPREGNDHAMDAMRYMVEGLDVEAPMPIYFPRRKRAGVNA